MQGNMILSAATCYARAKRAREQAEEEKHFAKEHVECIKACAREWNRRGRWAEKHGGEFNLYEYNEDRGN